MKKPSPKTKPTRICAAGDTTHQLVCECGRKTVLKASPEGAAIAAAKPGKKLSHGFKKRDGKSGFRQPKKAFGECESAVKL